MLRDYIDANYEKHQKRKCSILKIILIFLIFLAAFILPAAYIISPQNFYEPWYIITIMLIYMLWIVFIVIIISMLLKTCREEYAYPFFLFFINFLPFFMNVQQ